MATATIPAPTFPPVNHPWMIHALKNADLAVYGDFGQWGAIKYLSTGDTTYAVKAADKLLKSCSPDPADANTVRESFFEWCLIYHWIKSGIDADRDTKLRNALNRVCEFCFAINTPKYTGGWRYEDSDQTSGQVLGLGVADIVLGTQWTQQKGWIDGFAALQSYIVKSKGGEWLESWKYNLGTLKILFTAAYFLDLDLGEFTNEVCDQLLFDLTPDLKDSVQWGDTEEATYKLKIDRLAPLLCILYGLTGRADVYDVFTKITTGVLLKNWINLGWRALYFYKDAPKPASKLRVSTGNGHIRYKTDDTLVAVHFPTGLGVDHSVTYPCDIRWYRNGEWVINHPLGYGATAVSSLSHNSVLLAGLPTMYNRGLVECTETSTGFIAKGGTSGPFYGKYYDPPPPFLEDFTRKVEYIYPNKMIVTDTFKGVDPRTLAKFARYRDTDEVLVNNMLALWQTLWFAPSQPFDTADGVQWLTQGGQLVKLTVSGNKSKEVLLTDEVLPDSQFVKDMQAGYQVRLLATEPQSEIVTTVEVMAYGS